MKEETMKFTEKSIKLDLTGILSLTLDSKDVIETEEGKEDRKTPENKSLFGSQSKELSINPSSSPLKNG